MRFLLHYCSRFFQKTPPLQSNLSHVSHKIHYGLITHLQPHSNHNFLILVSLVSSHLVFSFVLFS
jgi:hypothetical protein